MKARVQSGTVLLYGYENAPERAELEQLFRSERAAVRLAGRAASGETLGALLGLPGYPPTGAPPEQTPEEKALIFYAFSDAALDRLLDGLRARGLAAGALKAVVTAHNRGWTLAALLAELCREREEFSQERGDAAE